MVPEHVNCNAACQNRKYRSELTLERYNTCAFSAAACVQCVSRRLKKSLGCCFCCIRQAGFRVISKTAHTLYRRSSAGFDSLAESACSPICQHARCVCNRIGRRQYGSFRQVLHVSKTNVLCRHPRACCRVKRSQYSFSYESRCTLPVSVSH